VIDVFNSVELFIEFVDVCILFVVLVGKIEVLCFVFISNEGLVPLRFTYNIGSIMHTVE
jgi:hypothetical protein